MSFTTQSTIPSLDSFASDLVDFAVTNAGFTDEGSVLVDSGTITMYRISKTTDTIKTYWWFAEDTISSTTYANSRLQSRMMHVLPTDGNRETLADGQRYTTNMGAFEISPSFTGYSFFTDGIGVFAALEVTSGVFTHINFGNLVKAGSFDGGAYLTANNYQTSFATGLWFDIVDGSHSSSSQVLGGRANLASNSIAGAGYVQYNLGGTDHKDFTKLGGYDHVSDGATVGASGTITPSYIGDDLNVLGSTCSWSIWQQLFQETPSTATFRAPLLPVYIVRQNPSDLAQVQMLGHVPNVTAVNMNLLSDKDLVNTDWRVFSLAQKSTDDSVATPAGDYGIAYKEIP